MYFVITQHHVQSVLDLPFIGDFIIIPVMHYLFHTKRSLFAPNMLKMTIFDSFAVLVMCGCVNMCLNGQTFMLNTEVVI